MEIILSDRVRASYPELRYSFFIVDGRRAYANEEEMRAVEARISSSVRSCYSEIPEWDSHPVAAAYLQFYSSMKLNPRKCSNPIKQAYRFLSSEYRSKSRLIDSSMEIEYTSGISFQLYDLDRLGQSLLIDLAEEPMPLVDHRGAQAFCKTGELVLLAGSLLVHCPSQGNGAGFGLSEQTEHVLVRVMGVPGVPSDTFDDAVRRVRGTMNPSAEAHLSDLVPVATISQLSVASTA